MFGVTAEISGQSSIELVTASPTVTATETEFGGGTSLRVSDLASLIDVQQESVGPGGAVVLASTGSILQSGASSRPLPRTSTILDDLNRTSSTSSPMVVGASTDAERDAFPRSRRQLADTILGPPEGIQPSASLFSATITRVGVRRGGQVIDDFGAVEILMARGR